MITHDTSEGRESRKHRHNNSTMVGENLVPMLATGRVNEAKSLSVTRRDTPGSVTKILRTSDAASANNRLHKPVSINKAKFDALFYNSEKSILFRRPKSIEKKVLLHRRNVHNLSSNRAKNTYSANNSVFEGRFLNGALKGKPSEESQDYGSGVKLRNYKLMNLIEKRNKKIIRPF